MDYNLIGAFVSGIVIYILGIAGLSYFRGRKHPYSDMEIPDFFALIMWPVLLGIAVAISPLVLSFLGIILITKHMSALGAKRGQIAIKKQSDLRMAEAAVQSIEYFEDDEEAPF